MSEYNGVVIMTNFPNEDEDENNSSNNIFPSENSDLLPHQQRQREMMHISSVSPKLRLNSWASILVASTILVAAAVGAVSALILGIDKFTKMRDFAEKSATELSSSEIKELLDEDDSLWGTSLKWYPPEAKSRCDWVVDRFRERDAGTPQDELRVRYQAQSTDPNVFYRATAPLFWWDIGNDWGSITLSDIGITEESIRLHDGQALQEKSTWTWVTGDQHLSNFGAWRNRHGEVVFSVNDFDEGGIYDFHVDVARLAVSICNHAYSNGLDENEVDEAIKKFAYSYVDTIIAYVGNEDAILFELTSETAEGKLCKFLEKVEEKKSSGKQMTKFTEVNATTGIRYFIKGDDETRLEAVAPEVEQEIRAAFSSSRYGATMMKTGWKVREWDDDYFEVLDVAARVGSGIGSFGVDRYYVLLSGEDGLLDEDGEDGHAVILDVKYEPTPALSNALDPDDAAWYKNLFPNEAARVVEAQRKLTSYVDPFTGWILLKDNESGKDRPFYVRQRSPWKNSFDLDTLTDPEDFNEFVEQVGIATATSHTRGTAAKAPGEFKHVIKAMLGEKSNRKKWRKALTRFAKAYREQVLLDFECFKEFVDANYS